MIKETEDIYYKDVCGRKEIFFRGERLDRFALLAAASEAETKEEAWEIMDIASKIFHPMNDSIFNTLFGSVAIELSWQYSKEKTEFYIHQLFNDNYSKIRSGKVVKHKHDRHNIPDSWVNRDGEIIPVEMKKENFDQEALEQLQRYINTYNSNYGIAVGDKLTVDLPDNIEFISIAELKEAAQN